MPSLSTLRAFEQMAHSRSFAEAARALNVTQAAIAQQVRRLENDLGGALAVRNGRTVELTPEGMRLAKALENAFEMTASAVAEFKRHQQDQPVQMATTLFIAQSLVLPRLHEFWARHPFTKISIVPTLGNIDIIEQGIDLAIRATTGEPVWAGLDAEFLLESEVIAVGSERLVNDKTVPVDELPWIWARGVDYEEQNLRALGLDPDKLNNFDIGAPWLQLQLAREGLGVTCATEIIVREDLKAGLLKRLSVAPAKFVRYYLVSPRGAIRPIVAEFCDWLKEMAQQPERVPSESAK